MYHPLGHRVLIKPVLIEEKSSGGILLDTGIKDKEDLELAEVVELGPQAYKEVGDGTPWCNVGDVIVFQRYAGKKIPDSKELYRVINDEDVIARREEK